MREIMISLNKNEAHVLLSALMTFHCPNTLDKLKASVVSEIQADLSDRLRWLLNDEMDKALVDEFERASL